MNLGISDKKVFITGGSRGIGKAIAAAFESEGACVLAPARAELDLSSPENVEGYISNFCQETWPDIFIHCAGKNEIAGIDDITQEVLSDVFQVNYFSPVMLTKAFAKRMQERNWGRIIYISSLYAIVSRERRIAYASSKNALTGLMKTTALELASDNIMVNAVAPGYVMTEMTRKNLSERELISIRQDIPTGRFQEEREIADICLFLCSDRNRSITGQLIAVDGGFLCH